MAKKKSKWVSFEEWKIQQEWQGILYTEMLETDGQGYEATGLKTDNYERKLKFLKEQGDLSEDQKAEETKSEEPAKSEGDEQQPAATV